MKVPSVVIRVVILLIGFVLFGVNVHQSHKQAEEPYMPDEFGCKFYNADGKKVPMHAVKVLVRSQFYELTPSEKDTLYKYFTLSFLNN